MPSARIVSCRAASPAQGAETRCNLRWRGGSQHGDEAADGGGALSTLVSRSGPMNISYSRSESAPNRSTTSSGFTTLPRDLLILWARAVTLAAGSPLRQYPSPARSTSAAATLASRQAGAVSSDTRSEACVCTASQGH